ncbi:MAG: thioredoxin family protein [Candidatus Cloacimonadales bacterium]
MMKRFTLLLIIVGFVSLACTAEDVENGKLNWLTNLPEAQKIAADKELPILINFTGSDWCSWCHKLSDEVFDTAEFSNYAADNLVLVILDFPKNIEQSAEVKAHNEKYMKMFGVRGFPTIMLVDSQLNVLSQMGYQPGGAEKFISDMEISMVFPQQNYDNIITTDNGIDWFTSLEKAQDVAQATGKRIFVNFTGSDWCVWCERIDDEILSTEQFQNFAAKNLVMLYLDFPQKKELPAGMQIYNQQLAAKYGVQGFPTILILDETGKNLKQLGYEKAGAEKFISDIKSVLN